MFSLQKVKLMQLSPNEIFSIELSTNKNAFSCGEHERCYLMRQQFNVVFSDKTVSSTFVARKETKQLRVIYDFPEFIFVFFREIVKNQRF
jgi:hypothetical protein